MVITYSSSKRASSARPSRVVVGITGASGILYGVKLLHLLHSLKVESHLVLTRAAPLAVPHETDLTEREITALAKYRLWHRGRCSVHFQWTLYNARNDRGAVLDPHAIGNRDRHDQQPATRAADVTLKERRRLVLMVRETPLTLGHIRAMAAATKNGAIIPPPVPAFYTRPVSLDDIITHTVARTLDLFGLDAGMSRWGEETGDIQEPRYGSRLADETNS